MARIRTVKPEFFVHEALFDAEIECGLPLRLAFAGLWTQADREGRFRWRPRALKTGILPYDEVDFATVLEALERYGFVRSYEAEGKRYGFIPSWRRHQHINQREADSVIPAPDVCLHVPAHGEKEKEGSQATRGPAASGLISRGSGAAGSTATLGHEGPRSHSVAAGAEDAERAASPPGRRGHGTDTRGGPGHDGLPFKNADRAMPVPAARVPETQVPEGPVSKAAAPGGQVPTASQWIYAKARELLALSERPHKNPSAIVGKWLRDHGEARLLEALRVAELKRSPEPVALIEGILRRQGSNGARRAGSPGGANGASGDNMFGGLRIAELGESDG